MIVLERFCYHSYKKIKEHTLSQQDPQKNYQINRVSAILSLNKALWGEVSPSLRAARILWNEEKVRVYFFYDGEISENDWESAECVATEVIADFPEHKLEVDILRWDYPRKIPNEGELVYCRKEGLPPLLMPITKN